MGIEMAEKNEVVLPIEPFTYCWHLHGQYYSLTFINLPKKANLPPTPLPAHPISSSHYVPWGRFHPCSMLQYHQFKYPEMLQQIRKQQIRQCQFQLQASEGTGNIKFPCSFFIEWKSSNNRNVVISPNRRKLTAGRIHFADKLQLTTNMICDTRSQNYLKKESIIMVNLVSNSRPNQPKLVGRVVVDLSVVANTNQYQQFTSHPLEYCSVEATITFKVVLKSWQPTTLTVKDLQRSQISEFEPISNDRISHKEKEDTKAEGVNATTSVLSKLARERSNPRMGDSKFEERISRIKAENELLRGKSEIMEVKGKSGSEIEQPLPIEVKYEIKSKYRSQIQQSEYRPRGSRALLADLSVPVLSKETPEFDSNKISQKTIQNANNSQKTIGNSAKVIEVEPQPAPSQASSSKIEKIEKDAVVEISFHNESQNHWSVELQSLKRQINSLKEANNSQKQQIQSQNEAYNALKTSYDAQKQELIRLQTDYKQQIEQLNSTIASQQEQIDHFNPQYYQKQIERLLLELQDKDNQLQHYAQTLKDMQPPEEQQQEMDNLRGEIYHLRETVEFSKTDLEHNTIYIHELEQTIEELKQIIAEKVENIPEKHHNQAPSHDDPSPDQQHERKYNQLMSEYQEIMHKFKKEEQNHKNTTLELQELRGWYRQTQEELAKIEQQSGKIKDDMENLTFREVSTAKQLQQLQEEKEGIIFRFQQQLEIKDDEISQLRQEVEATSSNLRNLQAEQLKKQQNDSQLTRQLTQTKKELDELQSRYMQLDQLYKLEQEKNIEFEKLLEDLDKKANGHANNIKRKEEEIENHQKKVNDLLRRLKEKEESISKLQREVQQATTTAKQLQFSSQQYKDKLKAVESQRSTDAEKIRTLEKDLRQLKTKSERDIENHTRQITKLKKTLQDESTKKKELSSLLTETHSKQKSSQTRKITQLQRALAKYAQKERLLKQNLNLLQYQSNKIAQILQEKDENEQKFTQAVIILTQQNSTLKVRLGELQNQCQLFIERNEGLQAEIELLNAYNPGDSSSNEVAELNKKLTEKNKDLLRQLEEKNSEIVVRAKEEGSLKGLTVQHQLSSSRYQKEKIELQQKLQSTIEQNEKLYKQFQKINSKYEQQLHQNNLTYQQKITTLQTELSNLKTQITSMQAQIEQLHNKVTQKELKIATVEFSVKDEIEKLQEENSQKDFQLQYYQAQINEVQTHIEALNSDIGEKELQMHQRELEMQEVEARLQQKEANEEQKEEEIRQLQQQIDELESKIKVLQERQMELPLASIIQHREGQSTTPKADQIEEQNHQELKEEVVENGQSDHLIEQLNQRDQHIEYLVAQTERLQQKQHLQQHQLLTLTQQCDKLRQNSQEALSHISYLESELKSNRKREQDYVIQIDSLQEQLATYQINQQLIKNKEADLLQHIHSLTDELKQTQANQQGLRSQLETAEQELQKLTIDCEQANSEMQKLRQEIKNSKHSTPISKFDQSPSPIRPSTDIQDVVSQITDILTRRKQMEELENTLRLVIDNNARQEEEFERWSRERGTIQEKAKLASKELQKVKASIMKTPARNIAEKTQLANLLKPTEVIVGELIHLSQTLAEMELEYEQGEEEYYPENSQH